MKIKQKMELFNISNIDELINNHEWHWCTSLIILAKHFETKNEMEEGLKNLHKYSKVHQKRTALKYKRLINTQALFLIL